MEAQPKSLLPKVVYLVLSFLFRLKDFFSSLSQRKSGNFPVTANFYPKGLGIETTNLCNANCIFCGYQYRERPVTFMSFEIFQRAVDQYVALGQDQLGLGFTPVMGDPLIDKNLVEKIAYAQSFPQIKKIHLTTNGILLTQDLFNKLVDAGLNAITVSISGFNHDEYNCKFYSPMSYAKHLRRQRDYQTTFSP